MVPPLQGPLEQPFCTSHAVPSVREVPATSQHYHKPCFEVHGWLKVGSNPAYSCWEEKTAESASCSRKLYPGSKGLRFKVWV